MASLKKAAAVFLVSVAATGLAGMSGATISLAIAPIAAAKQIPPHPLPIPSGPSLPRVPMSPPKPSSTHCRSSHDCHEEFDRVPVKW